MHFSECGVSLWPVGVPVDDDHRIRLCHVQVGDERKERQRDVEDTVDLQYQRHVRMSIDTRHDRYCGASLIEENAVVEISECNETKRYVVDSVASNTGGWVEARLKLTNRVSRGDSRASGD